MTNQDETKHIKHEEILMLYMGRRLDSANKMYSVFRCPDDIDHGYSFTFKKLSDYRFNLGCTYLVEKPDETSFAMAQAVPQVERVDATESDIQEWTFAEQAAKDEKRVVTAYNKVNTEQLVEWQKSMAPLRRAMRKASKIERLAMKLRLMELMERW